MDVVMRTDNESWRIFGPETTNNIAICLASQVKSLFLDLTAAILKCTKNIVSRLVQRGRIKAAAGRIDC